MKQNYTEAKLIQFIYGDCDIFDTLEIEFAMTEDLLLQKTCSELKRSKEALPKMKFSPNQSVVDAILGYSQSSLQPIC